MLFEEDEKNIIEDFQLLDFKEILLLSEADDVENILNTILDKEHWKLWTDSSGKADLPPDFFNDSLGLMMDVMRVDDHGFVKRGKTINPTRAREHELEKEIQKSGIVEACHNAKLIINAVTNLPTNEDHNYSFYADNFSRTVKKHLSNIENYRRNHPGYKTVFFVYDESSMYFCVEKKGRIIRKGEMFSGYPHLWFLDKRFTDVFISSEIDYLIWFTPYKYFDAINPPCELPRACIFDAKCLNEDTVAYEAEYMMSCEE